ncbi:amidase family protein [Streptomyces sp. NPDC047042]|uniref:amidase family protein n=1 Tax=Streptomyces sp. NPDC047042 TaxID=3154807 RepID=UPI003410D0D9
MAGFPAVGFAGRSRWRGPAGGASLSRRRDHGQDQHPGVLPGPAHGQQLFGPTLNPHDPERTAGGSVGGPAAAVAAHLTPADLGSDLAGSLRLPRLTTVANGLCPTHGLIPAAATSPACRDGSPAVTWSLPAPWHATSETLTCSSTR